jgi:coenzyme F420-reducing hydrogenase alpha subunit
MGSVVEINPITRVEGHGSLKVYLDGAQVERVELCLSESPRLFEALLVGRRYAEVPEIICRICSLCSTVHKVTALLALENAFGVEVSRVTGLTRELILNGGQIQSHSLHLYCLLLPDLLELGGVVDLAREAPELLKVGLAIKRVGNLIQETAGGRLIHPVNIVIGGLGQRIPRDALLRLRDELDAVLPACAGAYRLFRTPCDLPPLPAPDYLALREERVPFSGEELRMRDGRSFAVAQYRDAIAEEVVPHSHAKNALVLGRPPCVGALARLNLGATLGPAARELFDALAGEIVGKDMRANALAQAIELYQAAQRSRELVQELIEIDREGAGNVAVLPRDGRGSAACEAPRGVLIHSYDFDGAGVCTGADVITPTSLNQLALSGDLLAAARALGGAGEPLMARSLERLIRSYDPCISCAVHLVRL